MLKKKKIVLRSIDKDSRHSPSFFSGVHLSFFFCAVYAHHFVTTRRRFEPLSCLPRSVVDVCVRGVRWAECRVRVAAAWSKRGSDRTIQLSGSARAVFFFSFVFGWNRFFWLVDGERWGVPWCWNASAEGRRAGTGRAPEAARVGSAVWAAGCLFGPCADRTSKASWTAWEFEGLLVDVLDHSVCVGEFVEQQNRRRGDRERIL